MASAVNATIIGQTMVVSTWFRLIVWPLCMDNGLPAVFSSMSLTQNYSQEFTLHLMLLALVIIYLIIFWNLGLSVFT